MKILYVLGLPDSALPSQVAELLNFYSEKIPEAMIYLIIGGFIDEKTLNLSKKIKVFSYPYYPFYPLLSSLTISSLAKVLKDKIDQETIIHTRGELVGFLVKEAARKILGEDFGNILVDIRGASYEEMTDYRDMNWLLKRVKLPYWKSCMRRLFRARVHISVVSERLKKYLADMYGLDKEVFVNHSIAGASFRYNETIRREIKRKLKVKEDELLAVFSTGGNIKWQNTEFIVRSLADKTKVLLLSKERVSLPNVISIFAPYHEMPRYLSAADFGVIWRDRDIVNMVASPIKFSEYLSCGLPVIANDSVDLISSMIKRYNCGIVIEDFSQLTPKQLGYLLSMDRNHISRVGADIFSVRNIGLRYIEIYKKILEENR